MTSDQFREAIKILGLSQVKAGAFLGANERTSRRWAAHGAPAPVSVALAALVMLHRLGHDPLKLPDILEAKAWVPENKNPPGPKAEGV